MHSRLDRMLKPDLCVIGGGTAGHALALAAAALGLGCTLVDEREHLGAGQAADLAAGMTLVAAHARATVGGTPFDFPALRRTIAAAVSTASRNYSADRLRALGVTVIRSTARFADRETVMTADAAIRARRFVVATGARYVRPVVEGSGGPVLLMPDDIGRLDTVPPRLVVVATVAAGYAWAQCFRRLGSIVTLFDKIPAAGAFDGELLDVVRASLRRDGVTVYLDRNNDRLEAAGATLRLSIGGAPSIALDATHVLLADAPEPMSEALKLDHAGVRCRAGAPVVRADLRTSNGRIFAIGDVLGPLTPSEAAIPVQVGLVLRSAFFRQAVRYRADHVARTLMTDPPVAEVGTLRGSRPPSHPPTRVLRWPYAENASAVAAGTTGGEIKIRASERGAVLGVGIVGAHANELIVPWSLAVARDIPLGAMASVPISAFSFSDLSRRAALTFVAGQLRSPWVRRILAIMRKLG